MTAVIVLVFSVASGASALAVVLLARIRANERTAARESAGLWLHDPVIAKSLRNLPPEAAKILFGPGDPPRPSWRRNP